MEGGPDPGVIFSLREHVPHDYGQFASNSHGRNVITAPARLRRRSWSSSEKAKIVAESMEPGASVTAVARRHQLSRGLLWAWRRQAVDHLVSGTETGFVPMHLVAEAEEFIASAPDVHDKVEGTGRTGSIDIEIGGACVRVQGAVDPEALRQVLGLIGRLR